VTHQTQAHERLRRFVVKIQCADCGAVLNTSTVFENLQALRDAWVGLCCSSGLVTGSCPKGCRSTFSDCNINTRMSLYDADTEEFFDMRNRRLDELPSTREEHP
jgi:hypothetical protein